MDRDGYRANLGLRVRIGLLLLGLPTLATGIWAIVFPASWYNDYGHGIAPPSAFGHYNEHFIQDLGSGYLAIGVVLLLAAAWLDRRLVMGALIGFVAFSLPHAVIHLVEAGGLDRRGYLFTTGVLIVSLLIAFWLWRLEARREPALQQ